VFNTHRGKQVWLEESLVGKYPSILFEKNLGGPASKQSLRDLTFWRSRQDSHPLLLVK